DGIRGPLVTGVQTCALPISLKENQDEAFELLRLAMNEPRFAPEAVERIRAQIISRLQRQSTSPNEIATNAWWETAFPGHPYGRQIGRASCRESRYSSDRRRR